MSGPTNYRPLFEEQIERSQHLIKVPEERLELLDTEQHVSPSEAHVFEAALEALQAPARQQGESSSRGESRARAAR